MKAKKMKFRVGDVVFYSDSDGNIGSMVIADIDGQTLYDSSFNTISKKDVLERNDPRVLLYLSGESDEI